MKQEMTKENFILIAMFAGDRELTPIQLQKLLFLMEKRVGEELGGPFFNFVPYNYGPFDKEIYGSVASLTNSGKTAIRKDSTARYSNYSLTSTGKESARIAFEKLTPRLQTYISELATFVVSKPFDQLLRAIYKEFPEMAVNSVFSEGRS